jgi:hypothetical protein
MIRVRSHRHRPSLAAGLAPQVAALLAALLVAGGAGCGGKPAAPNAPSANLPPEVTATSPPARSFHVSAETAIWADFDRPLDASTVDTRHVALKIDTRRLPITVSYDAANRRIVIVPGSELALVTTHTVEFQSGLRTADGDSLGQTYFWQFTTLGVRRPRAPYPSDDAQGESPFVELLWQGTEKTAGAISYDLFADPDSNAVLAYTGAPIHLATERLLPIARWPQDGPLYWSVRTFNQTTGEQLDGPMWRFDPLPASTPVDSVFAPLNNWWYGNPANLNTYSYFCLGSKLVAGSNFDNLEQWDLSSLGPGTRLADAAVVLTPTVAYHDGLARGLNIRSLLSIGRACASSTRAPFDLPKDDQVLAKAVAQSDLRLRLDSDALSAMLESMVRRGTLDAHVLRATSRIEVLASGGGALDPNTAHIVFYVYRPVPPPASLHRR